MFGNQQMTVWSYLKRFLFTDEIYVFTPQGELRNLPLNSTVLDFAYAIHSEIGNTCIGAKVNHKLTPLNYKLKSGDQIEVIASDSQKPQMEWLDFVITAKAKSSITKSLKAEIKNRIEVGKNTLEKELNTLNVHPSSRVFKKLLPAYEVLNKDELYSKIGSGIISLDNLKKVLKKKSKKGKYVGVGIIVKLIIGK